MRFIGTIFGFILLLAILPFILQEPENFTKEDPEPVECEWVQVTHRDGYFLCDTTKVWPMWGDQGYY